MAGEGENPNTDTGAGDKGGQDDSLMTRDLEGDKGGSGDAGDKGGDKPGDKAGKGKESDKPSDDPADKAPDKPEGYSLKFAAETKVDAELLSGFQKTAHELGLSQAKAQKLAALYEAHAAKAGEQARAEQQKYLDDARKQWEAEIEKLPTFVQDREAIQTALRQFGDEELYDLLNQTLLGSHPKMWAFMAKVGKALAEPGFKGKNSGKEKSAAEVLYPDMK